MSVTDDVIQPTSDSFWEVDCYKRTVRRHEEGFKLSADLIALIQDRAHIEKEYAKSLKQWSKKWTDLIDKGFEYGTTEAACKALMQEAERVAEIHMNVKERLNNEVQNEIKHWRNETYHKSMVGQCKETKELEDGFKKAQKPWAKRLSKVIKSKKDYHSAMKLEKTATNQENNAKNDSSMSPDQKLHKPLLSPVKVTNLKELKMKKLQEKAEKCRRDVVGTKEKYEDALKDINNYNAKYMEDMTEIFSKCQAAEEKRLKFFKEMLYGIHKCLDISVDPGFSQIYQQLHQSIGMADDLKDLKWWSQFHGVDMPMNWPHFEEYAPDLHTISRKEKKGAGDTITLTSIKQNDTPTHAPAQQTYSSSSTTFAKTEEQTPPPTATSQISQNRYAAKSARSIVSSRWPAPYRPSPPLRGQYSYTHWNGSTCRTFHKEKRLSAYDPGLNPFGDDEEDGKDPQQSSKRNSNNGSAGDEWAEDGSGMEEVMKVPVRALYDYHGQEDDELSFKSGDVFMKLKNEDDQGWCVGEHEGTVGLYPKDYVEVI